MASLPRVWILAAACAAAALLGAVAGRAQDAPPAPVTTEEAAPPSLTIISRGPEPEFRIRGVSLKSARADDAQNTIAFDFNGPVNGDAFDQLEEELPDWIEIAYAGYDNAVIRAKRPVTFLTRPEADGFSVRMVARESTAAPVALRGADDTGTPAPQTASIMPAGGGRGWKLALASLTRVVAERPSDTMLRGAYDALRTGDASRIAVDGEWRHSDGTALITADGRMDVAAWGEVRLLADIHDVNVNSKGVRQLTGAVSPFNVNDVSGALGLRIPLDDASVSAEVLYGRSGFGGRIGIAHADYDWQFGMVAAYHEPLTGTAEEISLKGSRDYSAIFASGPLFDGLWGTAQATATRYGILGDQNVARALGWHVGLRYDIDGWPLSLNYDGDGEYLFDARKVVGPAPSPFIPLSLRNRETHRFGGAFSDEIDRDLWFDAYGGWAIDRYSTNGGFGGLDLRFTPEPGFDITLGGHYATVSERQGESGNVLSAGLNLTYAWGPVDAPIFR